MKPEPPDLIGVMPTVRKFLRLMNRKMGAMLSKNEVADEWNIMWVGGMWFQDLWTYDFQRTEMCVIPHATQNGEISFCAYNSGVGWRKIVESMHMIATTEDWFKEKGRHEIYAGDRPIDLRPVDVALPLVEQSVKPAPAGSFQLMSSCRFSPRQPEE